jgi:hypothetical protein
LTSAIARAESTPSGVADPKKISGLVFQLGSPRFKEREDATQQLHELGAPALEALKNAVRSRDPEIRRRAESLTGLILHEVEIRQILKPTMVRLACNNVRVSDAVADLAQKTGFTLDCRPGVRISQERITLDTGDVTFWEAMAKLRAAAGLVERLAPLQEAQSVRVLNRQQGRVQVIASLQNGVSQRAHDSIQLDIGKEPSLPTCYAGAVRIRGLPIENSTPFAGERRPDEVLALLEVSPQPKMGWQRVLDVEVRRAVDDKGQALATVLDIENARAALLGRLPRQRFVVTDDGRRMVADARLVPVRFGRAERVSRALKEVSGVVTAQVLSPLQPIFTVNDILKAQGKAYPGNHGELLKVARITRSPDGSVTMSLQVNETGFGMNQVAVALPRRGPQANFLVNGALLNRAGGNHWGQSDECRLTLADAQGRPFGTSSTQASMALNADGSVTHTIDIVCQRKDGEGDAARLSLSARRNVIVEIPFDLKDVPIR